MNCEQFEASCPEAEPLSAAHTDHLQRCARCRASFAANRQLEQALQQHLAPPSLPPHWAARLAARIAREQPHSAKAPPLTREELERLDSQVEDRLIHQPLRRLNQDWLDYFGAAALIGLALLALPDATRPDSPLGSSLNQLRPGLASAALPLVCLVASLGTAAWSTFQVCRRA